MKRKFILMLTITTLALTFTACSNKNTSNNNQSSALVETTDSDEIGPIDATISLGNTINVDGTGATVNSNKVTITSSGTYSINGTLNDGQIIVDCADEENVYLVLNNVNLTCSNSAPIYVKAAKNAIIVLPDGTESTITDGENYVYEDSSTDEPSAAIFSKDDLTIKGSGSLTVNANYNDGITSKDDLKITGGNISVNSADDGIIGKDSITIKDGNITINSQGDGLKSTNIEDTTKGYILVEGGTLNLTTACDGLQAESNITVNNGDITIISGGGSANASTKTDNNMKMPWGQRETESTTADDESTPSTKGIKATTNITINGGKINIDSADDSIHTNDSIDINAGTINLSSGDDGIHSDTTLNINGGEINITKSYEGIESANLTINDGTIHLVSSDDGINAAGGTDDTTSTESTESTEGRPRQDMFSSSTGTLTINGGYIYVDASGDGIDVNGSTEMTGGTVIVNGPADNGNGALDYDGTFNISGGTLIAAGGSGMAMSPSSSSTQASINVFTNGSSNTIVSVQDENGNDVVTFAPSKSFSSLVISTPNLKTNSNYKVYTGGSYSTDSTDGLYSGGTYSSGSELTSFTLSSTVMSVTSSGASEGGVMNGGMHGGQMPGGQRGEKPTMPNGETEFDPNMQPPNPVDGTSGASQNTTPSTTGDNL